MDVWNLQINDILEYNPSYLQSDTNELNTGNNFLATIRVRRKKLAEICPPPSLLGNAVSNMCCCFGRYKVCTNNDIMK